MVRFAIMFMLNHVHVCYQYFTIIHIFFRDSYWVIRGLLISEMTETARGMIENFVMLVKRFGFVPNGGRIYYSKRSQPPFLIPMSQVYYEKTKDLDFISENIDSLEQEYNHWFVNRTLNVSVDGSGKQEQFYQYSSGSNTIRAEGYKEDLELTKDMSPGKQTGLRR